MGSVAVRFAMCVVGSAGGSASDHRGVCQFVVQWAFLVGARCHFASFFGFRELVFEFGQCCYCVGVTVVVVVAAAACAVAGGCFTGVF